MKRILYLLFAVSALWSCNSDYDDSALTGRVDDLENRVAKLEELCKQMNTNISSLQSIVAALQNNDYVTGVAPITKNGEIIGYTISFAKSAPITIYHGENGKDGVNGSDGKDGQDGKPGEDGKDGSTPVVGVKQDTDGIYYWTLNGGWLLDDAGNRIKADGSDGKDGADGKDGQPGQPGTDGKDGIIPQLKIENGYWYISTDNGSTWTNLGKATGENGKDGDSFFSSVTQDDKSICLTLADGTVITIPKQFKRLTISILDSQAYEFEHAAITPNQELSLRFSVRYQNGGDIGDCQVEAFGHGGMSASIAFDRPNTPVQYSVSGLLSILAGNEINKYSRVTIVASDGETYAMKNITFEAGELYMSDDAVITVPAAGGDVDLNFMSNLDYEIIKDGRYFWIANKDRNETRAIEAQTRTITIAPNNSQARTGEVIVKDKNSDLQITYTVNQEASEEYLTARAALVDLYNATNGDEWITNTNWCSDEPINTWYGIHGEYGSWQVYLIDLQSNNLSGYIPSSIGDLTELKDLSLTSNDLTGELPASIGNCTKLTFLSVSSNNLSGALPEALGNCAELTMVYLNDNHFSGALPVSIGNWTKVEWLELQRNEFSTIPNEISGMKALQTLNLSYNKISNIPSSISQLKTNLTTLNLNHNNLEMEFPVVLCSMTNLRFLHLNNNKIYGNIPPEIGGMTNLSTLYMNQTYMSGEIPDELFNCLNLSVITLGHYHANELGEAFDASYIPNYKGLSGTISGKIGHLTKLKVLDLGDNNISGELPSEIVQCELLENLYLSDNNLTGTIPSDIGNLKNLTYLDLSYNNLSGEIPDSFWNLTAMRNLLLTGGKTLNGSPIGQSGGTNLFTGELPEEIGNMKNLQQFYLTNTNMTGTLPNAMLNLTNLTDCLLIGNRFSGILPKEIVNKTWWSEFRILQQQDGYSLTVEE